MSNSNTNIPQKLMTLQEKILTLRRNNLLELQNGDLGFASAPSNIALIKYWGKQPGKNQIPVNSSLSLTLGGFRSFTQVTVLGRFFPEQEINFVKKFKHKLTLKNLHQQVIQKQIPQKMSLFLDQILLPFAPEISICIESINNFPTACGIASSASGYAALVAALADLLQLEKHFTLEELSYWICEWSRIGSGSATRSAILQNNSLFVAWKLQEDVPNYSTKTENLKFHEKWNEITHCVLALDEHEKSTSSSEGHKYAQSSPLHEIRVAGIGFKFERMLKALKEFDFEIVKQISEEDAFSMHAVMQTGSMPACYLNVQVAHVISLFIKYRDRASLQAFWTLDAGPNIHFIYHQNHESLMTEFFIQVQNSLVSDLDKKFKIYKNSFGKECVIIGDKL